MHKEPVAGHAGQPEREMEVGHIDREPDAADIVLRCPGCGTTLTVPITLAESEAFLRESAAGATRMRIFGGRRGPWRTRAEGPSSFRPGTGGLLRAGAAQDAGEAKVPLVARVLEQALVGMLQRN